jgi:protein phosphatase
VANEHAKLGILSEKEAQQAPTKHMLTRSLGSELFVSVEVNELTILSGDVFLLCCDGLHNSVEASEIAAIIGGADANLEHAAQRLVDIANHRDGSDNISLQIIRVRGVDRVGMYRGRPYRLA